VMATIFFVVLRKLDYYSRGTAELVTEETIRSIYFVGYMMAMWSFIRILHALPVIWLSCILKLYTIVFVLIKDELEELKEILSMEDVKKDEDGKIDGVGGDAHFGSERIEIRTRRGLPIPRRQLRRHQVPTKSG